jgi:hypothetical protein
MKTAFKPLPVGMSPLGEGLHDNVPADAYHSDPCVLPSLSSGVARVIAEKTPAHAFLEHVRLGGSKPEPTSEMILGGAVHALMAGGFVALDAEYSVGNYDNYTTKAAREWRESVTLSGKLPVLEKTVARAYLIAGALRTKIATAGLTNNPCDMGKSEVTAVWQEDGIWLRARYDRLILDPSYFADVWDWKTTGVGVTPDALIRIIIDKGYHIQAAHYLRGLRKLLPEYRGRLTFNLAFVETEAPFAVRIVPICEGFLSIGERLLGRAIADWRQCLITGEWPDGSGQSLVLTPPTWYLAKVEEAA